MSVDRRCVLLLVLNWYSLCGCYSVAPSTRGTTCLSSHAQGIYRMGLWYVCTYFTLRLLAVFLSLRCVGQRASVRLRVPYRTTVRTAVRLLSASYTSTSTGLNLLLVQPVSLLRTPSHRVPVVRHVCLPTRKEFHITIARCVSFFAPSWAACQCA